jgi:hypothetical protein
MTDTYADLPEDERPHGVENAKAKVAEMLADPKFKRGKGHKDVDRTRDDDQDDPKHNVKE